MQTTKIPSHPQCRSLGEPSVFGPDPSVQNMGRAIDASGMVQSMDFSQHGFRPHPSMVKQGGSAVRILQQRH